MARRRKRKDSLLRDVGIFGGAGVITAVGAGAVGSVGGSAAAGVGAGMSSFAGSFGTLGNLIVLKHVAKTAKKITRRRLR